MVRLFGVLLCTALLQGCLFGREDTTEPPADLVQFDSSLAVKRVWSTSVGKTDEDLLLRLMPALLDDALYATSGSGLRSINKDNGRTLWQANLKLPISSGPGAGEGLVAVGTLDGEVVALDAASGEERWRSRVSSEVLAPPVISSGIVVVRSQDGRVFGFDANTGQREWVFDQSTPSLTLRGNSTPVIAGGFAFVGFDNGKLYALRVRDGSLAWEATVGAPTGRTDLDRMVDVDGQLMVVGGELYAVGFHSRLVALTADAGRGAWARDFSSSSGVSVSRRQLFLATEDDEVWSLDRFNGGTLWRQDRLARRAITTPTPHGDAVVVGDFDGYLHWLSGSDGSFVARARAGDDAILVPPLADGDLVYTLTQSGRLSAWRLD